MELLFVTAAIGALVFVGGAAVRLSKALSHKYLKRVPYTARDGKRKYRYWYKLPGSGKLVGRDDLVVGAAFKAEGGHYHVTASDADGGKVTVRHDETGKEATLSHDALAALLHEEHKGQIAERGARLRRTLAEAEKVGNPKLIAARKRDIDAHEDAYEPKPKPEPKPEPETKPAPRKRAAGKPATKPTVEIAPIGSASNPAPAEDRYGDLEKYNTLALAGEVSVLDGDLAISEIPGGYDRETNTFSVRMWKLRKHDGMPLPRERASRNAIGAKVFHHRDGKLLVADGGAMGTVVNVNKEPDGVFHSHMPDVSRWTDDEHHTVMRAMDSPEEGYVAMDASAMRSFGVRTEDIRLMMSARDVSDIPVAKQYAEPRRGELSYGAAQYLARGFDAKYIKDAKALTIYRTQDGEKRFVRVFYRNETPPGLAPPAQAPEPPAKPELPARETATSDARPSPRASDSRAAQDDGNGPTVTIGGGEVVQLSDPLTDRKRAALRLKLWSLAPPSKRGRNADGEKQIMHGSDRGATISVLSQMSDEDLLRIASKRALDEAGIFIVGDDAAREERIAERAADNARDAAEKERSASRDTQETASQGAPQEATGEAAADAVTEYDLRRKARAERLATRADSARAEAARRLSASRDTLDRIPMGQPILTDHYSAKRHRRDLERSDANMRAGIAALDRAKALERSAAVAENNPAVFSDDPRAIQKLRSALESAEREHQQMKAASKVLKSTPDTAEARERLRALGFSAAASEAMTRRDYGGGYWPVPLANTSANVRRIKARIDEIEKSRQDSGFTVAHNGATITDDVAGNRVRIVFPGKPDDATRKELKSAGFRWAPSEGAWQRHRSVSATYHAARIVGVPADKMPARSSDEER